MGKKLFREKAGGRIFNDMPRRRLPFGSQTGKKSPAFYEMGGEVNRARLFDWPSEFVGQPQNAPQAPAVQAVADGVGGLAAF